MLLAVLSPLLLAIAAVVVADSGLPVLYRQERVGRREGRFTILKFRTMVPNAEGLGLGLRVAQHDPRITRVGRALRSSGLDELPQLFNVLVGDMSLVGPRPTIPDQVARYTSAQRRRLEAKPGITGWAQVNGRNSLPWERRIELDVWYVDHTSFWLDARILGMTLAVPFRKQDVYGTTGITRDLDD